MTNLKMKSREEIRFLALLSKTQEKAAKLKTNQASKFNSETTCDDAEISNIDLTEDDDWRLPKVFQFHQKFKIFIKLVKSNKSISRNFL